ncbi:MAG: HEAT repeat domain-containing protein [Deltaproteobacteria bacterium]|nr:HEAT repeat domain-containing protein [Deltaproteobacteria bacterium]
MRSVAFWSLCLASTLAAGAAHAQLDTPLDLGTEVRVQVRLADGSAQLELKGRGRPVTAALPSASIEDASARTVTLAGGARVGVVTIPDRAAALVVAKRGRPEVLWVGQLSPHGDPGEQRTDVLQIADRTGDGVDDVIVGYTQQGRSICGEEQTLLEPRAIDPGALALRSVTLRNLGEATETAVEATTEPPEGLSADSSPLLALLAARGASSAAGRSDPPLPVALVDDDPATAWTEAAAGNGRWEFATLRVTDPGLAIRALRFVPRTAERTRGVPRTVYVQGSAGSRLAVTFPREPAIGEAWWVTLPEPTRWSCASVVLGEPHGNATHVGLAELDAFSEVDFGGGIEALVSRLAAGGEEGARAARALRSLGPDVLDTLHAGWEAMTPVERRLVLRVAAAHPSDPRAAGLFAGAAGDPDEAVRGAALSEAEAIDENDLLVSLASVRVEAGTPIAATADGAAMTLLRRAPDQVGIALDALAREGGEDRPVLRRAIGTAAKRGGEAVADILRAWIPDAPAAARASLALGLVGHEEAAELAALAVEGAPGAEAFADRWRFAQAAGQLESVSAEVTAWLFEQTRAEEWMMRAAALQAVTALGTSGSVENALGRLDDETPRVRIAAIQALASDPQQVVAVATRAREDRWPIVRAAAVTALGPHERARPVVKRSVRDRHELVRSAAIAALAAAEDWSAWELVEDRLSAEREWPVVLEAGVAFAEARCDEDAIDVLGAVIERAQRPRPWQPDVEVAARAVRALAAIGGEEAAELIRRAASDLSPQMIRIAAEAAGEVPSCRP